MESKYNRVYDFTNENVSCLKYLYHFENSKVLSVVGSGDQYFASVLNGAKKVDLFDINPTSYLYFLLKFYSIRELTYDEFYDFLVLKKFNNLNTYKKLEPILPVYVLKYYKYLLNSNKANVFKKDGINLISKKNQKYYFKTNSPVIPYFEKKNYYFLQEKLKKISIPSFCECNIWNKTNIFLEKYDIILMSNIYSSSTLSLLQYTDLLKGFDCPEIQAFYDWHGDYFPLFICGNYCVDRVKPSSPSEFSKEKNFVYSLRK